MKYLFVSHLIWKFLEINVIYMKLTFTNVEVSIPLNNNIKLFLRMDFKICLHKTFKIYQISTNITFFY